MDKFFIIANRQKDKELKTARKVEAYLNSKGKSCILREETSEQKARSNHYTDVEKIPKDVECIIVIGGDGTLLQAARDVVNRQIPLLGINMGTLGYLAEIDRSSIDGALNHLMLDEYTIEKRMMLNGKVYHKEELIAEDVALNDIVIGRDGPLHVTRFHNYVNGEFLNSYTADGIIIATATGSTGYSLSAGGPIVSPTASMLVLTPICPHTLNSRSIVFSGEDHIRIEIGKGRRGDTDEACATFDGDAIFPLKTGDYVEIKKSREVTRILKINQVSFLEVLRNKLSRN
mgnify:CR=1 FL=1